MAELKLIFEYGECNGYMSLQCYSNDTLIADSQVKNSEELTVTANVDFPFDLRIKVSGKNLSTDTVVEHGKIIKDKYVKLKQLYLARYPVKENILYSLCKFTPENKSVEQTNYFYCNGEALLHFQAPNALKWHLLHNQY